MRNSTFLIALLAFAAAASTAQPARTTYEQLFRPQGTAAYHVPIGLCEDYPEESTTLDIIRADMAMLKRTGIDLLRVSFGWDGIETEKGKYNWGFWDDFVRIAAEENGITLVPYICYTPAWNSTGDTTNYWNHTPKDYESFGPFVEALVNRYKKNIRTWELWNEPDIREYWSGNAADLAKLTKIGAMAVKKADPTAKVVLAGLAGHTEFTLSLFRDLGISPYVDAVNCHSYYETWHGDPIETVVPYVQTLSDIIAKYGNHQSLWMAEVGYSTVRQPHGKISDSYTATYAYEHTLAYQAVALWRTLTLLLSTEKMAAITWYEIKDLPAGENVIGDNNNRNLGVDFVGHKPKPAESALRFFNAFFGKPSVCIDRDAVITRAIGSESEVHVFRMEDGSVAVVAWLKTHIKGKVLESPEGALDDKRAESVDIVIPMKKAARATLYDELGAAHPFTGMRNGKGTVQLKSLSLTGGTIAILKITP
jgi:polysaccharide biosynthesis protein PslG